MTKKDRLYTVNRYNKNLFEYGGPTQPTAMLGNRFDTFDNKALVDQNMAQAAQGSGSTGGSGSFDWGGFGMGVASAIPNTPMEIGGNNARNGIWDAADPTWYLADGRESKVGNALSDTGVALTKAGAQSGNPWIMLAGAGLKIGGSLTNAIGGIKENKANVSAVQNNTQRMRDAGNMLNYATSTDSLIGMAGNMGTGSGITNTKDLYKGGWSRRSRRRARNKANNLLSAESAANAYQNNALITAANNVAQMNNDNVMSNFAAFGGMIDTPFGGESTGALDYDFMKDYLFTKRSQALAKDRITGIQQTPTPLFAFGGDLQTHGSDFSTGAVHIGAGGSHEQNPNDGVQMGVDGQGVPNLVEEGEVVFNDYVYSNRIQCDEATKNKFHIGKKKEITYAELAKRLEKEISERPNDPISKASFKAQMGTLADEQERQKQEMEAERAKAAFEALSPEEQTAVMQQAMQQEQMAQEQAAQQQAMAEQQAMQQQPSEEELAAMQQQQMMQADGSEAMIGQEPQMNACGGRLHKFDKGGELFKSLGFSTMPEFIRWINENGISLKSEPDWDNMEFDRIPWKELMDNPTFQQAAMKRNASLLDAISRGYDFGEFVPTPATTGYDWDNLWIPVNEYSKQRGNSADKYRIDPTYSGDIKALENSDEYKAFTDYILNNATDDERMKYFQWIDANTGRDKKYIKNGKLVDDWKDLYQTGRTDGLYGIQHYTPKLLENKRGNKSTNLVYDDESGKWTMVYGNIGKDWILDNTYKWDDKDNNNVVNYYRKPSAAATPQPTEEVEDVAPNYRNEKLRYAGLMGPAVGLGLWAAGVGKPNYKRLDAAVEIGNEPPALADYRPIGNYLTYTPLDVWAEQNRLNANARATDRAILNSNATQGTKTAGLLADGYNDQIASGELFRKAQEYNDAKRAQVAEFNRGTDQYNASAYNNTSQFNAGVRNQNQQLRASLAMQAAQQRMAADHDWYNSLYGNIGGLFNGISELGRENAQWNMLADMAARGDFGNATPDTPGFNRLLRYKNGKNTKR